MNPDQTSPQRDEEPVLDAEIYALSAIVVEMETLDPATQARVARWVFSRYEEADER